MTADRSNSERDGLAHSVQVRLVRHAKEISTDPNLVLTRYAVERFLYRLSRSPYVDRFVLKGALLMLAWFGDTLRPTRDADLLGFGDLSDESLKQIFLEVCDVSVEPDGMTFRKDTVQVEPIRVEDAYGGRRITLTATLGAARLRVQVDVGIGDAVVPSPDWLEYPSLLDLPRPRLRAYFRETVIAEKLHAIVLLGDRNSRLKDYFDLHALAKSELPKAAAIAHAIAVTFERRNTKLPEALPVGFSDEFAATKQAMWLAFLKRSNLQSSSLSDVIHTLREFYWPLLQSAAAAAAAAKT